MSLAGYDNWLLQGEPGGAGGDFDEEAAEEMWRSEHPSCETCGETTCLFQQECGCEPAVGFEREGHVFCEGACADEARATLAEDFANDWARAIGEAS